MLTTGHGMNSDTVTQWKHQHNLSF